MTIHIPEMLSAEELGEIRKLTDNAELADGAQSAGKYGLPKKNNQEVRLDSADQAKLRSIVMSALQRNNEFRLIAMPRRIVNILFSLYGEGMYYGDHSDNAIMDQQNDPFRSDLAMTIFLNDPEDYEGGDLVLNTDLRPEQRFKLPAGDGIIYPTFALHRVDKVTKGERRVAITWIQSLVRSPQHRQILFDIARSLDFFIKSTKEGIQHPEAIRLDKVYHNLIRLWAEV